MRNKQSLVFAAVVIAAIVGIGAWAVSLPASPASDTCVIVVSSGTVFGADPAKSGIENIYIMDNSVAYVLTSKMGDGNGTVLGVIESSAGSVNVTAGTAFDIVIAYKAHGDDLGYIRLDNAKMEWKVSGAYTVGAGTEITDANETIFENTAPVNTAAKGTAYYMRVNALGTTNWTLTAGQSISLDNVSLWIWG